MVRSHVAACRSGRIWARIATRVLVASALLTAFFYGQMARGQSQDSATLQGTVKDSGGRAIAGATVCLQGKTGTQTVTALTDSEGIFRFSALGDGAYTLRAEMAGYAAANFGPFVLGQRETKRIDLTLESGKTSPLFSGSSGAEKAQFFDEPKFAVAGVTEAMNPGGHGSDTILRTTEALTKETASLSASDVNKRARSRVASASSSGAASEESLRKETERDSGNFDANHGLGKLLADEGKAGEALPYLERASQLNPADYENAHELALAYVDVGQYARARSNVQILLSRQDKSVQKRAELHHLLGDVEEKLGNPLEAVREYQRAVDLDPSESNLFDWGAELLAHRAFEPAIEVFSKGNRLFPRSARMLSGLGVAFYALGSYDQADQRLCEASDVNLTDPNPYLFMGKMLSVEPTQSECVVERLQRFVRLQPENALANYYYAISLRRREESDHDKNAARTESLLENAVHLDPKFGEAYLQLGILYAEQGESAKAIAAYEKATEANPGLEEAHFRLAQAYSRTGEKTKAQAELQLYQQLAKKRADDAERQRHQIQQFVYTLRDRTSATTPQ
jgi:tetratricopeptide (TPR) repeat protein